MKEIKVKYKKVFYTVIVDDDIYDIINNPNTKLYLMQNFKDNTLKCMCYIGIHAYTLPSIIFNNSNKKVINFLNGNTLDYRRSNMLIK